MFLLAASFIVLLVGSVVGTNSSAWKNSVRKEEGLNNMHRRTKISSSPGPAGVIKPIKDLSIWIDEDQVKLFSGIQHIIIHVVANGLVMPHLLDRNMETHLPVIPPEVEEVRFKWTAGERKYRYNFYRLESHDQDLLLHPRLTIPLKGRIPKKHGEFTLRLVCTGNLTGIASFSIGLEILSRRRRLAGTPLKLRLRKDCLAYGRNPKCDRRCGGRGECDSLGRCVCGSGWGGENCSSPVCSPQCMNGGFCSSPGACDCPAGFQGPSCEGGVCTEPCLNRGECVQKDTCRCRSGYYGSRCEFSKCVVPCLNGGICRGVNRCRCEAGYAGHHCQLLLENKSQTGLCSQQSCASIKSCRQTHCSFISRRNRSERRTCKMAHCGGLFTCDVESCNRKRRSGRRGRRV